MVSSHLFDKTAPRNVRRQRQPLNLACRLPGSLAEDVAQETYARWTTG